MDDILNSDIARWLYVPPCFMLAC